MNCFTVEEKELLDKLVDKAENSFFSYLRICEQIESLLIQKNPEEESQIHEVLYQMGDGICVSYSGEDELDADNNIPVARFINGERI